MFLSRITSIGVILSGGDLVRCVTLAKTTAFTSAFLFTILFHYKESLSDELTKNELIPSIQDSIGHFYPNKSFFQISIGIFSFFFLIFNITLYTIIKLKNEYTSKIVSLISLVRFLALIFFSNVPFHDDPQTNNNSLVIYFISTAIFMYYISSKLESRNLSLNSSRVVLFRLYSATIILATWAFFRHQVQQVKYQYSISSLLQWFALFLDTLFDYYFINEFRAIEIRVLFPDPDKRALHV